MKYYYVYILTNKTNKVLYVGVTNSLLRRVYEHKQGHVEGFSKRYNLKKLVFSQDFTNPTDAITAEKRIKGWIRKKKIDLIESQNPDWKDLSIELEDFFNTKIK